MILLQQKLALDVSF